MAVDSDTTVAAMLPFTTAQTGASFSVWDLADVDKAPNTPSSLTRGSKCKAQPFECVRSVDKPVGFIVHEDATLSSRLRQSKDAPSLTLLPDEEYGVSDTAM